LYVRKLFIFLIKKISNILKINKNNIKKLNF